MDKSQTFAMSLYIVQRALTIIKHRKDCENALCAKKVLVGLVWFGLVWKALNPTQSVSNQGRYRAARAAKKG